MTHLKLMGVVACLVLFAAETASAQPGWRHRYYYGYGAPVVVAPPVVVAAPPPPPMVVPQPYAYPAPAYVAPAPIYPAPVYGYGVIGPRRHVGFGYAAPGFGVYIGR